MEELPELPFDQKSQDFLAFLERLDYEITYRKKDQLKYYTDLYLDRYESYYRNYFENHYTDSNEINRLVAEQSKEIIRLIEKDLERIRRQVDEDFKNEMYSIYVTMQTYLNS